jgi:predicted NBD/HSP70 family sugar kinase
MRLGLDLGGTKIEVAALDESGAIRLRRRVATPPATTRPRSRRSLALSKLQKRNWRSARTIGIAMPARYRSLPGASRMRTPPASTAAPSRGPAAPLGREVRLANDANCFALSEAVDGAARGARVVFGVILGTGVGGGIVVDRRVVTGANAIAGEWGHNPLPLPEPRTCRCPLAIAAAAGCIETYLSGPAWRRIMQVAANASTPPTIVARAAGDDCRVRSDLDRYEARLARSLAGVINMLDPT